MYLSHHYFLKSRTYIIFITNYNFSFSLVLCCYILFCSFSSVFVVNGHTNGQNNHDSEQRKCVFYHFFYHILWFCVIIYLFFHSYSSSFKKNPYTVIRNCKVFKLHTCCDVFFFKFYATFYKKNIFKPSKLILLSVHFIQNYIQNHFNREMSIFNCVFYLVIYWLYDFRDNGFSTHHLYN